MFDASSPINLHQLETKSLHAACCLPLQRPWAHPGRRHPSRWWPAERQLACDADVWARTLLQPAAAPAPVSVDKGHAAGASGEVPQVLHHCLWLWNRNIARHLNKCFQKVSSASGSNAKGYRNFKTTSVVSSEWILWIWDSMLHNEKLLCYNKYVKVYVHGMMQMLICDACTFYDLFSLPFLLFFLSSMCVFCHSFWDVKPPSINHFSLICKPVRYKKSALFPLFI